MSSPLPTPQRRVTLRIAGPADDKPVAALPPEALDTLLTRARTLGLPLHPDPQIGAILASLRLREDIPATLYAAAASVLACVYDAAGEPAD